MQAVVEAEREARDEQRRADADLLELGRQLGGCERAQLAGWRQSAAVELDHRDVDLAAAVAPLAPEALALRIQRHREAGGAGEVDGIEMKLDLEAIGEMLGRCVE